jgi:precorrin-3B C17-methyltransferase
MGKIYIVGIGPGHKEQMTLKACNIIEAADIVVGYSTYVEILRKYFTLKEVISSGMRQEVKRCTQSLSLAEAGKVVVLVSSGDPGIYGMAGVMLEVMHKAKSSIKIEVVPGVTSSSAAAALLGAPLMHDFATISLSDLLTGWEVIKKRIKAAAEADFIISIYNPMSNTRTTQLEEAREIMLKYKAPETPVGIVKNAMRDEQEIYITDLAKMMDYAIDMRTILIIGNAATYRSFDLLITPRGYQL